MKLIYTLIAITASGEYVQRDGLSLGACAGHLALERRALLEVQARHPEIELTFRCEAR